MISTTQLQKVFGDKAALSDLTTSYERGTIYGLVGANGSGKSTFLRLISGVYYADGGEVLIDGEPVYDNPDAKSKVFFVSDDLYFPPGSTLDEMAAFYKTVYPRWDGSLYHRLGEVFPLPKNKKISTFSKGMRRQAALMLALSSRTDCLLLDEAFDGLDPVVRFAVRKLIADDIAQNNLLVIISSHNLRELEDFCDAIGLLHQGKMLMEFSMDSMRSGFSKVQAAFPGTLPEINLPGIRVVSQSQSGSLITLVCQASEAEALAAVKALGPAFVEAVPLTLEEVFVYEMEAAGYNYAKIVF
jgi:ABC-2 type transport system ATP-binding protein